jgi:DNA-binding Lrp family transcriptional regulator
MRKNLDELDRSLLKELLRDSNRSYRALARDVGMSPAAIIERIRFLEEEGYVTGYGCRVDYSKLGFEFMALVEIRINSKDMLAVEKKISRLPHVAAVWDTTGEYDAVAIVMCKNRSELSSIVKRIHAMDEVERTKTNTVLNVVTRLTEFYEV